MVMAPTDAVVGVVWPSRLLMLVLWVGAARYICLSIESR